MNFASPVRTSQLTVRVQKEFHPKLKKTIFGVQIQLLKFQRVKENYFKHSLSALELRIFIFKCQFLLK